jgi:hypothetical protein
MLSTPYPVSMRFSKGAGSYKMTHKMKKAGIISMCRKFGKNFSIFFGSEFIFVTIFDVTKINKI